MEELIISPYLLAVIFFFVAFAYSAVGLAGGSSYTALMAIFGLNALQIPLVTLTLNTCVATIGSVNFIRNKHVKPSLVLPFFLSSIPMSYLGGALQVSREVFYWLLLVSLVVVAARIYLWKKTALSLQLTPSGKVILSVVVGATLGLVSGIVGIGGGIYLVPLIIIFGLGTEKQAAACGVLFILLNSVSGLVSRLQYNAIDIFPFAPVIVAAVVGGALGSYLGSSKLAPATMQKVLGLIVLVAIGFLLRKVVLLP